MASALLFGTHAVGDTYPKRLIAWFCVWLCTSFVLRELDVERLNVPELIKPLGSGVGRNILLAASLIGIMTVALRSFKTYRVASLTFLRSSSGILLISAGGMLLLGGVFDELKMLRHNTLLEESAELCGYCLILLASMRKSVL
ncbi:MAG: hypothetical protein PsegKO_32700 [Pseudohongiellaceae bacterium]